MQLFRFNPTVRETNKYLNETVELLLKKHGNVSNEEFEKELTAITGIGWKQVKNYKNHPKPSERLKDNSLIKDFVFKKRREDTGRKVRIYATWALSVSLIGMFCVWLYYRPKPIETVYVIQTDSSEVKSTDAMSAVETKAYVRIGLTTLVRLGSLKHSKLNMDKFTCTKLPSSQMTNCTFKEGPPGDDWQITLMIKNDLVERFSVQATRVSVKKEMMDQTSDHIAGFKLVEDTSSKGIINKKYQANNEDIQIVGSSDERFGAYAIFATFRPSKANVPDLEK